MSDDRLLRSALWYARHGWYVVPLHTPLFDDHGNCTGCTCEAWKREKYDPAFECATPGKHPRLTSWESNASRDTAVIRGWWQRWPTANVGIAAGRSGLLVLDADSYKDQYTGEKLLTADEQETITSLSGGGGSHLLYAMPDGADYGNAMRGLPDGIDVRGHGGQFVAPPSLHPSGNHYQWELGYGPHEMQLLALPDHIVAILDAAQQKAIESARFSDVTTEKPDLSQWRLSARIRKVINETPKPGTRSETDQSVITALIMAGANEDDIRAVFEHYPIGTNGKFNEKGNSALQYLAHSIGRAKAWCDEAKRAEQESRTTAFIAMATR